MKKLVREIHATFVVFDKEEKLLAFAETLKDTDIKILDIFSPYPLDTSGILYRKSPSLYKTALFSGIAGFLFALGFQLYFFNEFELQFGEKWTYPLISFVIPCFLAAILFSGLGVILHFGSVTQTLPGQIPEIYNNKATSDKFLLVLEKKKHEKILTAEVAEKVMEGIYYRQEIAFPIPIKLKIR